METTLQLTIDCDNPHRLVTFWSHALGYAPEAPPGGHATWRDYWSGRGVPEDELPPEAGMTPESIVDPTGRGPRVWFQQVPEPKVVKNRVHLDHRRNTRPLRRARRGARSHWEARVEPEDQVQGQSVPELGPMIL